MIASCTPAEIKVVVFWLVLILCPDSIKLSSNILFSPIQGGLLNKYFDTGAVCFAPDLGGKNGPLYFRPDFALADRSCDHVLATAAGTPVLVGHQHGCRYRD